MSAPEEKCRKCGGVLYDKLLQDVHGIRTRIQQCVDCGEKVHRTEHSPRYLGDNHTYRGD